MEMIVLNIWTNAKMLYLSNFKRGDGSGSNPPCVYNNFQLIHSFKFFIRVIKGIYRIFTEAGIIEYGNLWLDFFLNSIVLSFNIFINI